MLLKVTVISKRPTYSNVFYEQHFFSLQYHEIVSSFCKVKHFIQFQLLKCQNFSSMTNKVKMELLLKNISKMRVSL